MVARRPPASAGGAWRRACWAAGGGGAFCDMIRVRPMSCSCGGHAACTCGVCRQQGAAPSRWGPPPPAVQAEEPHRRAAAASGADRCRSSSPLHANGTACPLAGQVIHAQWYEQQGGRRAQQCHITRRAVSVRRARCRATQGAPAGAPMARRLAELSCSSHQPGPTVLQAGTEHCSHESQPALRASSSSAGIARSPPPLPSHVPLHACACSALILALYTPP